MSIAATASARDTTYSIKSWSVTLLQSLNAFRLDGKLAVITGAAAGIGRTAAELFVAAGARVVLADYDSRVAEAATKLGAAATAMQIDLSESDAPRRLAVEAEQVGPVDIWINVAGVVGYTPIDEASRQEYDRIMRINLDAVFWCCAAIAPAMKERGRGSIINVSSNAADQAVGGLAAYAASKGAVNSLTRVLATELGPHGIRVNALAPGFIVTGMTVPDTMTGDERQAFLAFHSARSPMGVTGTPADMANALLYLGSEASRFMTGQVMRVNGGATMR